MKLLGLIVNPIAGMGGRVGLKGTDGFEILEHAIRLGAKATSSQRAIEALRTLRSSLASTVKIITCPQAMGEDSARVAGFDPRIIEIRPHEPTTAEDSKSAAKILMTHRVDLLLFVGGDGTARDICDAVDQEIPCLGIPAGVKTYSAVFSTSPRTGGELVSTYLDGDTAVIDAEIFDVDESAFRADRMSTRLYGYLRVPFRASHLQTSKTTSPLDEDEVYAQEAVAKFVEEELKDEWTYIIGPGSTTTALGRHIGFQKTMLGVDVIRGRILKGKDLSEQDILKLIDPGRTSIIVTPIGGQGFLFGRGNLQISAEVIRRVSKENIMVIATKHKIHSLKEKHLLVDTGDAELDRELSGYIKAITGYREYTMLRISG